MRPIKTIIVTIASSILLSGCSGFFWFKPDALVENKLTLIKKVKNFRTLYQLSFYNEIIFKKRIPRSTFKKDSRLTYIVKGYVHTGLKLTGYDFSRNISVKGKSIRITLPAPVILHIDFNPSNITCFDQSGPNLSETERAGIYSEITNKLHTIARENRYLQQCRSNVSATFRKFFMSAGFREDGIRIDFR